MARTTVGWRLRPLCSPRSSKRSLLCFILRRYHQSWSSKIWRWSYALMNNRVAQETATVALCCVNRLRSMIEASLACNTPWIPVLLHVLNHPLSVCLPSRCHFPPYPPLNLPLRYHSAVTDVQQQRKDRNNSLFSLLLSLSLFLFLTKWQTVTLLPPRSSTSKVSSLRYDIKRT